MAQLPSGTVTLLFSDIEGSTALVRRLGDDWGEVLDGQRRICRDAWSAHGGQELGTEGDSFFVVFDSADGALAAAAQAQRALAEATWVHGERVDVRIGIHTGSPRRHADGYIGLDVHKAARIASSAHGRQVLLSQATLDALGGPPPSRVDLRDLGPHRLKDIPDEVRLFRADIVGVPPNDRPPRTLGGIGGLPRMLTPTVGRDGELAELAALLLDDHVRLVTLTGPGGSGKTRLSVTTAAQVADRYPDGVFFVPLTDVVSGETMWTSIATALDVPAEAHQPSRLVEYVAPRVTLLVLDNLEQLEEADRVVHALLQAWPGLTVLATSRRPLHVEGEHEHSVPPLGLPVSARLDDIAASGAVQMFLQHGARVRSGFSLSSDNAGDVAALCRALDGLPLALELVAARLKLLSPRALLARLDSALDVSAGRTGGPQRQRTLRRTIGWSYDLLPEPERRVLDHLGVFEGGADLVAVTEVVPADVADGQDLVDLLFELVDASLVKVLDGDDGEPRFFLLETIRRFALAQLEQRGGLEAALNAHAQHFYDRARRLRDVISSGDYRGFRNALQADLDNYQAIVTRARVVVDPTWYEGPVPPEDVAALLGDLARHARMFERATAWLTEGATRGPTEGALACRALLVDTLIGLGRSAEAGAVAADVVPALRVAAAREPRLPRPRWLDPLTRLVMALGDVFKIGLHTDDEAGRRAAAAELRDIVAAYGAALTPADLLIARDVDVGLALEDGDQHAAGDGLVDVRRHAIAEGRLNIAAMCDNNLADVELRLGRRLAAQQRLRTAFPIILSQQDPTLLAVATATLGEIIGPSDPLLCARAYAATSTFRVAEGIPNGEYGDRVDAEALAPIKALVAESEWQQAWDQGLEESVVEIFRRMLDVALPPDPPDDVAVGPAHDRVLEA